MSGKAGRVPFLLRAAVMPNQHSRSSAQRSGTTLPEVQDEVRGPSVLLVEDDVENRESIAEALQAVGCRVHVLASAAQALKMLEDPGCPSLILLDLWMPGMGGRELLAAVALRPDRDRFRIIVMSAANGVDALVGRPRVVEVLRKPFALEKLLAAVGAHV